jgi:hypothetical protein
MVCPSGINSIILYITSNYLVDEMNPMGTRMAITGEKSS